MRRTWPRFSLPRWPAVSRPPPSRQPRPGNRSHRSATTSADRARPADVVVVMSEDDLEQALQDAADLAQAKANPCHTDPDPLTGDAALSWLDEVVAGA